jgi:class IV lanthipeptide synthase
LSDWDAETYVRQAIAAVSISGHAVRVDRNWVTVQPVGVPLADHGWKLHVSSKVATFPALVAELIPVLLAERCHFKLACSTSVLSRLNQGVESPASVGKAVTIYPDQSRVRALGLRLADLLRGHEGPRVLSDLRVDDRAPVYYRYGPFLAKWYAGDRGSLAIQIPGPADEMFDGVATLEYRQPPWAADPFAPTASEPSPADREAAEHRLLGGRYRVTRGIYQAAPGNVYRAVDTETGRRVIVKQARAHVGEGKHGSDARSRLRNERRLLQACQGIAGIATFIDHFSHGADEFLVTTDVGDLNLLHHVRLNGSFLLPDGPTRDAKTAADFARLAAELAALVITLHEKGVIMRDITPRNVILGPDRAFLVDFGIAALDDFHLPGGTPGFAPLRQLRDDPPRPEDDCYSLGMTLAFAACGMVPVAGIKTPGLGRQRTMEALTSIYGDTRPNFIGVIEDLLSGARRTAREALRALASESALIVADGGAPGAFAASRTRAPVAPRTIGPADVAWLERRLLDIVVAAAGEQLLDESEAFIGSVDSSVYTGSAGVGLELLHHRDRAGVPEILSRLAVHAIAANRRVSLDPGLYSGTTGIDIFLQRLTAGGVENQALLPDPNRQDLGTSNELAKDPGDDIMSGIAGIGLGNIFLAEITGEPKYLDTARECAEKILHRHELKMSVSGESGLPDTAGVDPSFGYAHGLAGVVDFLLAMATRTGDNELYQAAHIRAVELRERARTLSAAAGATSAVPITVSWCQGLAGAARTLLHAGEVFNELEFERSARSTAATCAGWIPRMENLAQCCGVCGVGSALVDIAQGSGDERCWDGAHEVVRHLLARSHGPDEEPLLIDPARQDAPLSWGMGNAGILAFLRRLNRPDSPDLLPPVLPARELRI